MNTIKRQIFSESEGFFWSHDMRPNALAFPVLPLGRRCTFAPNSFATMISASECHKKMNWSTDELWGESSRSHWLDGLSPGVSCFQKSLQTHTLLKRGYGHAALPFLLFGFSFFKAKNSMMQNKLSHFFTPVHAEKIIILCQNNFHLRREINISEKRHAVWR